MFGVFIVFLLPLGGGGGGGGGGGSKVIIVTYCCSKWMRGWMSVGAGRYVERQTGR